MVQNTRAQTLNKSVLKQSLLWQGEVWHARNPYQAHQLPDKDAPGTSSCPQDKNTADGKQSTTLIHHQFTYPLFFLTLPLSNLHAAANPMLGLDKLRLCMLCTKDHGDREGNAWLPWIRQLLREENIASANGEVVMQTFPRVFGFVFNPVSFWFCHDQDHRLRAVLCEINNTFGDRHNYLVAHPDERPIEPGDELTARKVFHVSPFFPVAGEYRFRFDLSEERHLVAIDYWINGQCALQTHIVGKPSKLTAFSLARAVLRQPLLGFSVTWRIHWQALLLWIKHAPFHSRPKPPSQTISR